MLFYFTLSCTFDTIFTMKNPLDLSTFLFLVSFFVNRFYCCQLPLLSNCLFFLCSLKQSFQTFQYLYTFLFQPFLFPAQSIFCFSFLHSTNFCSNHCFCNDLSFPTFLFHSLLKLASHYFFCSFLLLSRLLYLLRVFDNTLGIPVLFHLFGYFSFSMPNLVTYFYLFCLASIILFTSKILPTLSTLALISSATFSIYFLGFPFFFLLHVF